MEQKNSSFARPPGDQPLRCFYSSIRNKAADASTFQGGRLVDKLSFVISEIDESFSA